MGVIYKIISPSNKLYIGKTYNLKLRIAAHKHAANKMNKDIILHNSIRKYGWGAHILVILEECHDDILNEREIFWIAELKTYCYENVDGMNMTKGGDGQRSTWMHKTKLRKYFSDKFSGKGNPFYGKTHTPETKKRLSELSKIRNIKDGRKIPKWGIDKGRDKVVKPVVCYDNKGDFYKEYISVSAASKDLNILPSRISATARGEQTNCGGYIFRYKSDNYSVKIQAEDLKYKNIKRPLYVLNDSLIPVLGFSCAQEASDFLGIPKTTINRAAQYNNLNPIRNGYIFIYKSDYIDEYKLVG